MSSLPVIFTAEEQQKLAELKQQILGFQNFETAVSRSLHSGEDALIIHRLLQFLKELSTQSMKQMEDIESQAKKRSTEQK